MSEPSKFMSMLDEVFQPTLEDEAEVGSWPAPLRPEARCGLVGDVVEKIAPTTEADPAAVLLSFVTMFGNCVGRGPWIAGSSADDRHHANVNVLLVGSTSTGRKGTSAKTARAVVTDADPSWGERIIGGLSSGEGLIHAVRDERWEEQSFREKGERHYERVRVDAGVADKRALFVESEFAATLRVMAREGNTLSERMRQAWDGETLQIATKNFPERATGAHVSIIGHVTGTDLKRFFGDALLSNGFANRTLFALVRRSRRLPDGGGLSDADRWRLAADVKDALDHAREVTEFCRDEHAREVWHSVYDELSGERPEYSARAVAQAARLSLIYALADRSSEVREAHLWAALAVVDFCDESARLIFGETTGHPIAARILAELRRESSHVLTRTAVSYLFDRHEDAAEIDADIKWLEDTGVVETFKRPPDGGIGRPAQCVRLRT